MQIIVTSEVVARREVRHGAPTPGFSWNAACIDLHGQGLWLAQKETGVLQIEISNQQASE